MRTDRVIAFGNARLASTRCPGKMLRPLADTTLTDLALERLSALRGFDGVYFAAYEPELQQRVGHYPNVTLIERSHESAHTCNPITTVHDYLQDLDFDYAFWINSCHPLLRPETIEAALTVFRSDPAMKSLTAVCKTHNWFYALDGTPINNVDPTCIDTKRTPPLYEVVHAFHCFRKTHLFATASYWNNLPGDPHLFEIEPIEAVDVDTESDFLVAAATYTAARSGATA